jgi:hypothetical protein
VDRRDSLRLRIHAAGGARARPPAAARQPARPSAAARQPARRVGPLAWRLSVGGGCKLEGSHLAQGRIELQLYARHLGKPCASSWGDSETLHICCLASPPNTTCHSPLGVAAPACSPGSPSHSWLAALRALTVEKERRLTRW